MGHPFCFGWARENKDNSSGKIKRRSKQRDATATAQWPMEGLHPTLRQRREGWGTRFVLAGRGRTRTTAAARSNAGLNKGTTATAQWRWRVYIPPFAKDAKDGSPVLCWLGEREQGQQQRQDQAQV